FQPSDNGQHVFNVILETAGVKSIVVADTVKPTVRKAASATVSAATMSGFLISGFPLTAVHNVAHALTVTAVDAFGNRINNYTGTVQFSNAGGSALLPSSYTFKPVDGGRHSFKVTLQSPGTGESLTVTDANDAGLTGTLDGITVV